ncbi:hypothetical protein D5018_00290 [Parashewanella curva]|uniref:Uncharacterized protein n=1 Tax=Parashewanella curva TaxID=2338552 RepID=A0A3L8Q3U2_9GAMM|nr:hypothetical protein [Parashewanella curva]RLV61592.1 hypothetical protein D5018_00290 [Parashewanella curva]
MAIKFDNQAACIAVLKDGIPDWKNEGFVSKHLMTLYSLHIISFPQKKSIMDAGSSSEKASKLVEFLVESTERFGTETFQTFIDDLDNYDEKNVLGVLTQRYKTYMQNPPQAFQKFLLSKDTTQSSTEGLLGVQLESHNKKELLALRVKSNESEQQIKSLKSEVEDLRKENDDLTGQLEQLAIQMDKLQKTVAPNNIHTENN